MIRKSIHFIWIFCISIAFGQYQSPFNQLKWENDSTANYTFIVSGHFYGGGSNVSRYPANTLLGNLDWINDSGADALICLGDLFKDVTNDRVPYTESFFSKLEIPLVNTVGNHDLTGSVYQDTYGETSFSIEINGDLHLIIDTERDNGDIVDDQLELLQLAEEKAKNNTINNVFIYTHRTIWSRAYEEMDGLFLDNTQSLGGTNFKDEVRPILNRIGETKPVYLFSGSLGSAPASFFHFEDGNTTIIATAIRALLRDAMLIVEVENGQVSFKTKSLTTEPVEELTHYGVAYWQSSSTEEPFNWKLVPYYFEVMLTHRFFWYGVGWTLLGTLLLIVFVRRRRAKKATD